MLSSVRTREVSFVVITTYGKWYCSLHYASVEFKCDIVNCFSIECSIFLPFVSIDIFRKKWVIILTLFCFTWLRHTCLDLRGQALGREISHLSSVFLISVISPIHQPIHITSHSVQPSFSHLLDQPPSPGCIASDIFLKPFCFFPIWQPVPSFRI